MALIYVLGEKWIAFTRIGNVFVSFTLLPLVLRIPTTDLRRSTHTTIELHHPQREAIELRTPAFNCLISEMHSGRFLYRYRTPPYCIGEFHASFFTFAPPHHTSPPRPLHTS